MQSAMLCSSLNEVTIPDTFGLGRPSAVMEISASLIGVLSNGCWDRTPLSRFCRDASTGEPPPTQMKEARYEIRDARCEIPHPPGVEGARAAGVPLLTISGVFAFRDRCFSVPKVSGVATSGSAQGESARWVRRIEPNARAGARNRRNRIVVRGRHIWGGAWHRHGERPMPA